MMISVLKDEFVALLRIANAADLLVERSPSPSDETPGRAEYDELLRALDAWDALLGSMVLPGEGEPR